MNVLKQACEGDLVAVWVESGQTTDVCEGTLAVVRSKLAEHLVTREDSVRFYPLCANCVEKVETIGDPPPKDEILFVV